MGDANASVAAGKPLREWASAHGMGVGRLRYLLKEAGVRPCGAARVPGPFAARVVSLWDGSAVAAAVAGTRPPAGWLAIREYAASKGLKAGYVAAVWHNGQLVGGLWGGRVYLDPDAERLPLNPVGGVKNARKPAPGPPAAELDPDELGVNGRVAPDCHRHQLVPFGPSGLLLYADDLEFLARVRAKYPRPGREGR